MASGLKEIDHGCFRVFDPYFIGKIALCYVKVDIWILVHYSTPLPKSYPCKVGDKFHVRPPPPFAIDSKNY